MVVQVSSDANAYVPTIIIPCRSGATSAVGVRVLRIRILRVGLVLFQVSQFKIVVNGACKRKNVRRPIFNGRPIVTVSRHDKVVTVLRLQRRRATVCFDLRLLLNFLVRPLVRCNEGLVPVRFRLVLNVSRSCRP